MKESVKLECNAKQETHLIVDASPFEVFGGLFCHNRVKNMPGIICDIMLAVVWAVEHFKEYLYGARFKVFTDHKPLIAIVNNTSKETSARLDRLLRLQGNFVVMLNCCSMCEN